MPNVGIVLDVLAALLLGAAGMLGFGGFGMDSGMMRIGAMITPTYPIVIIGLGLLLTLWLSRQRTMPIAAKGSSTVALDISKTRYAKGESTKEQ